MGNSDGIAFGHLGEQEGGNRGRCGPSRMMIVFRSGIRGSARGGIGRGLGHSDVAAGAGGVHDIASGLGFTGATARAGDFSRHAARERNRSRRPTVGREREDQCEVDEWFHDGIVAEGWVARNGESRMPRIPDSFLHPCLSV